MSEKEPGYATNGNNHQDNHQNGSLQPIVPDQSDPGTSSTPSLANDPEKGLTREETRSTIHPIRTNDLEDQAAIVAERRASRNPFLVDWEGEDDPQNPFNWANGKKARQLVGMAFNTFLTPLASSMFAPGVADVMQEFHSTSSLLGSFAVSIFLLGYMVGPLLIAPMSELYGRVPCYHVCNIIFLVFTIACAVSDTLAQLFVFRFLAGVAGSCPLAIGSGTAADMIVREKRAGIMAIWAMGPIMGPIVGPIAGGFLTEYVGWRWVFWVISIATGANLFLALICYRESYAPVILGRKAARLRKETGNSSYMSIYDTGKTTSQMFWTALARPIKLLFLSPIVFSMALFASVTYGYLYLMFTTITPIFETHYGWSQGIAGLAYLGFGIGSLLALIVFGRVANHIALTKSKNGTFKPEDRLPPMAVGCWCVPVGLFWYGWSVQAGTHWIVPILGTMVFGVGLISIFMAVNTYLVDTYLMYAASVTAANAVLRSLVGCFLPLAGPDMYAALGIGWGNSLLAFIALALCPVPFLFLKYGERIRTNPKFQLEL